MESDNGSLFFKVRLDNDQLAADAAKSRALLRGIGDAGVASGARLDNSYNRATKAASSYVGVMALGAVASIGILGKSILDVTAKFEKFGIVLKNTLGDTKGAEALTMIANFAATTPFQLDEVTGAFIKMANQGFVPTRQEMIKLGDLASSTGKSFDQLAEAVLDAQTGQFERLKEFGIKASANGDRVTFSFKEQKTTVENTNKAIQNYLLSLGELKGVAGANEKISASLTGQLSNLGDKLDAMYNKIGSDNKGILYTAVGAASKLIENYEAVGEAVGALVAVYGLAKVATMVWVAQENARAAVVARNIAIEAEYTALMAAQNTMMLGRAKIAVIEAATRVTATNTVIAAEERLAATSKATALFNPYTALAVAIAAVGYAIYKVVTYQTDLEKAIVKTNTEIENEKDKIAQLKAELNHATEGTDAWKKAKQAILDQYGTYLTEQQKELLGTKNQAEAYGVLNKAIEENIALKVKRESLDAISQKFNDKIVNANQGIQDAVKESLGRDRAASVGQDIAPLIANVKIAVDKKSRDKATKELQDYLQNLAKEAKGNSKILDFDPDVMRFRANLLVALKDFSDESIAVNNAFDVQQKKIEASKKDPILTTYKAQIEEIKKKKAIAQKELEALKVTPGENPMKAIVAKQGEIDEYNKQLGIKEKAAKEEEKRTRTMIENSKEYLAIQQQIIDKVKELDAANASKNTTEGIRITKEISVLEKQLKTLADGGSPIKPISATIHTVTDAKEQLKPMKQLTEEERKQLEIKGKKASADALALDNIKEELEKRKLAQQQILEGATQFTNELIDQLGLSEQQTAQMKEMVGMVGSVASGNWIGAIFQAASMVVGTLKEETVSFLDITNEQISKTNDLLALHSKILSGLTGDDYYKASAAEIKRINLELDSYNKKLAEIAVSDSRTHRKIDTSKWEAPQWLNALDNPIFSINGGKEATAAILGQIADLEAKKAALIDEMYQKILGFGASDVSDSIFKGIEDGLKLGENSLGGFAQSFGDLMKKALMQAIIDSTNTEITTDFLPKVKEFLQNNEVGPNGEKISPREQLILEGIYSSIVKGGQEQQAATKSITDKYGTSTDSRTGSSKGIAQASQDSVDELNGRFTAIQGHTFSMNQGIGILVGNSNLILKSVQGIEKNTMSLSRLEAIEKSIDSVKNGIDTINLKGITLKQ